MAFEIRKSVDPYYAQPKRRAEKKPAYLAFIHHLPSCVSGQYGVQAAHVSFPSPIHGHHGRGRQTKAPDLFAVPLTPEEHARQHDMSERAYWAEAGICPHSTALALWALYSMYPEDEAIERCTARIRQGIQEAKANG